MQRSCARVSLYLFLTYVQTQTFRVRSSLTSSHVKHRPRMFSRHLGTRKWGSVALMASNERTMRLPFSSLKISGMITYNHWQTGLNRFKRRSRMAAKQRMSVKYRRRISLMTVRLNSTVKNLITMETWLRISFKSRGRAMLIKTSMTSEKQKWSSSSSALVRSLSSRYLGCIRP